VTAGQLGLFGNEAPAIDARFERVQRIALGEGAWVEYVPGWLTGHRVVFDALSSGTRWRHERREMYERIVDVPRLYAVLPDDGPGHSIFGPMKDAISARYAEDFVRVSLALYRGGQDSVAWHDDQVTRRMDQATVATVSVGEPRKLLLRPKGGGKSLAWSLGWGDLFVMGGSCQRTHEHSVPKVANAAPRLVIMFRPLWEEPRADSR